jgi:hypothetical protein
MRESNLNIKKENLTGYENKGQEAKGSTQGN